MNGVGAADHLGALGPCQFSQGFCQQIEFFPKEGDGAFQLQGPPVSSTSLLVMPTWM